MAAVRMAAVRMAAVRMAAVRMAAVRAARSLAQPPPVSKRQLDGGRAQARALGPEPSSMRTWFLPAALAL
jgi:hypothetical protein